MGLKPLARIRAMAVAGCAPEIMGIGPVRRDRKALKRAGLEVADLDIIELNEAFAVQALAVRRRARPRLEQDVNLDGGAIALGHPLGATGARITGKAAALLKREGKELRAGHPMHRRRSGHRHDPGGRLMAAITARPPCIGAGVMGGGIAAHIANAGIPVVLLDIVPPRARTRRPADRRRRHGAADRSRTRRLHGKAQCRAAHARQHRGRSRPARGCRLDRRGGGRGARRQATLYAQAGAVRKAGLDRLLQHLDHPAAASWSPACRERFARDFLITHFFNPPRYMRLLEIVAGPDDAAETSPRPCRGSPTSRLGKGVVVCKDTPGFIANRIGTYWMQAAVDEAIDLGLTVEEADAVIGRPMGIPEDRRVRPARPGRARPACRMSQARCAAALPPDDAYHAIRRDFAAADQHDRRGLHRPQGQGRLLPPGPPRRRTGEGGDRPRRPASIGRPPKPRLEASRSRRRRRPARAGRASRQRRQLRLARARRRRSPTRPRWCRTIADDIVAVDRGHAAWLQLELGPFELIDRIGAEWLADALRRRAAPVPPLLATRRRAGGFYRVRGRRAAVTGARRATTRDVVRARQACCSSPTSSAPASRSRRTASASLWDIGDGVLCLEFTSKMNALDHDIIDAAATARSSHRRRSGCQGAGDPQRGRATSRSAPTSGSPCSPPTSRCGR